MRSSRPMRITTSLHSSASRRKSASLARRAAAIRCRCARYRTSQSPSRASDRVRPARMAIRTAASLRQAASTSSCALVASTRIG